MIHTAWSRPKLEKEMLEIGTYDRLIPLRLRYLPEYKRLSAFRLLVAAERRASPCREIRADIRKSAD